ncbi:MFS transporter [Aeromicrobium sp. 9AM]|uniref:MFS transporter n=1 Tax=Aeromicrobium sp. 9AM TaxID=2653126 RepID=UPI0012F463FD|nr:MFS transporter [Aeromicrobium sp. 9AM]VXB72630.1 MFS transporter [Aeromicrobium sp. 9AM]
MSKIEPSALPSNNMSRGVSGRWVSLFSLAWLGLWMAQLTALQLLLPAQVAAGAGDGDWKQTLVRFGWINAISGLAAMVAYPLVGAMSDRYSTRFGRRRPWIAAGGIVNVAAMIALSSQTALTTICVLWSLSIVGFCAASSGLTSMICDQVPISQRGYVSGWIAIPQALGIVVGVSLAEGFTSTTTSGYLLLAAVTAGLIVPAVIWLPDHSAERNIITEKENSLRWSDLFNSVWISPRRYPDFGWALLSRALVNLSNALSTGLLLYFYTFDLRVDDPDALLQKTAVVYVLFAVVASISFGRLSDRIGRRRPFVLVAGLGQAASGILLAVSPSVETATVGACLLGAGTGAYFAVDQALSTQVLPNPADHGKDLGIMNIALILPQAFGPILGAAAISVFGDFPSLFMISGVTGIVGACIIYRVKGVR